MLQAILFDCEGVIIDSESVWDKGQEELLRRRGFVYDRAKTKPLLTGRSLAEGVVVMQQQYGFQGDVEAQARERQEIVRDLFAQEVELIPGFRQFFEEKVRGRYRTCIATAMTEELFGLVDQRLGLSRLFEGHVYFLSHVGGRSKPNPDLFLFSAAQLGVPPERCLVIEDAPHGIEAARRAGMASVGLATTYDPSLLKAADQVVRSFEEIHPGEIREGQHQEAGVSSGAPGL
jgi:HAD superfamily hydrolase (TIGR01509 family)